MKIGWPKLSDREQSGLRGPVKELVDEYSTTVFDTNGNIIEWSGNTMHGHAVRTYVYDEGQRLIRVSGSEGDYQDEFSYDGPIKTQIRRIPACPDQKNRAYGFSVWFDAACEGEILTDGGTVETKYNENGQPVENRVLDDEGSVLFSGSSTYDSNGRLRSEMLKPVDFPLLKAIREQIPIEQRAGVLAQLKAEFHQMMHSRGLFGDVERTYLYNEKGQLAERVTRMGANCERLSFSYNEPEDFSELIRETSQPSLDGTEQVPTVMKHERFYEYDRFSNWTTMVEITRSGRETSTSKHIRQVTYFSSNH